MTEHYPATNAEASSRFLRAFAIAGSSVLALWIALVMVFDPFLAFGTRALPKTIIQPTSRMLGDEQLIKDHLFQRLKPESVIIGSSRSAYGLDPRSPNLGSANGFNNAMLGASLREIEGLAAQARRNAHHVKRLVIGIDHYMFFQTEGDGRSPADRIRNDRMEHGHGPVPIPLQHLQTFLLSTKVGAVMEDMLDNWRRKDTLGEADQRGLMHGTYRFRIADRWRTFEVTLRSLFVQGWYRAPDEAQIAARLRRIAGMLRSTCQSGLKVDVILSPEHAMLHEAAALSGQLPRRQQLRRDMARMMALMSAELPGCLRYRDASGLFESALEPLRIPGNAVPQFIEVSHYAPVVGERLLLSILNPDDPRAIGIDPSRPGALEADIQASATRLEKWRRDNPDDAAFVKRHYETSHRP